mmetsp:Transcript_13432/g.39301  ORF Transcript_13432/g.39301 Transcript_13432/m.39301 type:complete len:243 (+) Transcript_13432:1179-1907(+)
MRLRVLAISASCEIIVSPCSCTVATSVAISPITFAISSRSSSCWAFCSSLAPSRLTTFWAICTNVSEWRLSWSEWRLFEASSASIFSRITRISSASSFHWPVVILAKCCAAALSPSVPRRPSSSPFAPAWIPSATPTRASTIFGPADFSTRTPWRKPSTARLLYSILTCGFMFLKNLKELLVSTVWSAWVSSLFWPSWSSTKGRESSCSCISVRSGLLVSAFNNPAVRSWRLYFNVLSWSKT